MEPIRARILVHVTQDDIDKGKSGNIRRCPVALALNREVALENDEWRVGPSFFFSNHEFVRTPRSVERFVPRFDQGRDVKPFKFYVKVSRDVQARSKA